LLVPGGQAGHGVIQPWCCPRAGPISSRFLMLLLLLRDEGLLGRTRLLQGRHRRAGARPHLDGPRPRVVEAWPRGPWGGGSLGAGGRLGAASLLLLLLLRADGGALATPATTRTTTAVAAIAATLAAAVVASAASVGAPGARTGVVAPRAEADMRRRCRSPGRGGEGGGWRRLVVC